jgi:hypothetical protein
MTENEKIKLLSDSSKTNNDLCVILCCSTATISRWRKKYGIVVPRGLKPGQHNNKITNYTTQCNVCGTKIETTPSHNQKYCSSLCMHSDKNYKNKLKTVDKSYMQTDEYRKTLLKDDTPEFRRFRNRVSKLSEQTYNENKAILNPNNYKRTLCGVENGFQLDHIVGVRKMYDAGATPEEVSRLENLQLLPWKQNLLKQ